MADAYLKMGDLHTSTKLAANHLSVGSQEFSLRINDLLWAARYRALVGDYSKAKNYA